jgi:hypothetical protein
MAEDVGPEGVLYRWVGPSQPVLTGREKLAYRLFNFLAKFPNTMACSTKGRITEPMKRSAGS